MADLSGVLAKLDRAEEHRQAFARRPVQRDPAVDDGLLPDQMVHMLIACHSKHRVGRYLTER